VTDLNSSKEVFEGRQNLANDTPVDVSEYLRDGEPWDSFWGSLAEAYAEFGIEMHVYFRAGFVKGSVAGDFCAVFNRTPTHKFNVVDGVVIAGSGEAKQPGRKKDEMRQSMLIHVVKLVEPPKGIGFGKPFPSCVRLQPLDLCLREWVDAPEHAVEFVRVLLDLNRESGVPFDFTGHRTPVPGNREFKRKVVESTSEVVEAVSDNKAKFRGWRVEHFDPKDLFGAINIGFGPGSVRTFFDPSSNFGFKAVQVIERSLESPFVVESHD